MLVSIIEKISTCWTRRKWTCCDAPFNRNKRKRWLKNTLMTILCMWINLIFLWSFPCTIFPIASTLYHMLITESISIFFPLLSTCKKILECRGCFNSLNYKNTSNIYLAVISWWIVVCSVSNTQYWREFSNNTFPRLFSNLIYLFMFGHILHYKMDQGSEMYM